MRTLANFTAPVGFHLLQMGASGVGKSHRALEIALSYGPVLVLDYDRNISRMVREITRRQSLDKVILADEDIMYSYDKLFAFVQAEIAKKELPYATVLIDTATFLSEAFYEELQRHSYFGNPSNTLKLYGELGARMTKIMKEIQKMKVNFIMNCHEKVLDSGATEIIGKGNSSDIWAGLFTEKHRLTTRPKSLVPRVKAAMSDGLVTSRTDLLDADGFFKEATPEGLFDMIAVRR